MQNSVTEVREVIENQFTVLQAAVERAKREVILFIDEVICLAVLGTVPIVRLIYYFYLLLKNIYIV